MKRSVCRPSITWHCAAIPAAIGHLLRDHVFGQTIDPLVVEPKMAHDRQDHTRHARLTSLVCWRPEVDSSIFPESCIHQYSAGADGLRIAGRQAKSTKQNHRVGRRCPFRCVKPSGPSALRVLQCKQLRAPPFPGHASLLSCHRFSGLFNRSRKAFQRIEGSPCKSHRIVSLSCIREVTFSILPPDISDQARAGDRVDPSPLTLRSVRECVLRRVEPRLTDSLP
jgi:hypothetical protein